jgi:glycosyltransferase involved in cell wall biosynthesis
MPAYNHEAYVERALSSVLSQTVRDLELVVLDDGSSDRTPALLAAWAARDSRVRLVRRDPSVNAGVAQTLIECMEHAQGAIVTTIASDDVWRPDRLERQLPAMDRHGWSYCIPRVVDEQDARIYSRPGWTTRVPSLEGMLSRNTVPATGVLFRRELYDMVGGLTRGCFEDWSLWVRMRAVEVPALIGEPLVDYRIVRTSLYRNLMAAGVLFSGGREVTEDALERGVLTDGQRALVERYAAAYRALSLLADGRSPASAIDALTTSDDAHACLEVVRRNAVHLLEPRTEAALRQFLGLVRDRFADSASDVTKLLIRARVHTRIGRPARRLAFGPDEDTRRAVLIRRLLAPMGH